MKDDIDIILLEAEDSMKKAIEHLDHQLTHIRAGKANPKLIDNVMVEYYGSMTPLPQVANISTPDAKTIAIQPWEKGIIRDIEKAIMAANLGFNPDNNGEMIRISIPPLTEERRRDLVKQAKQEGEEAKISIRLARRDSNVSLKKLVKEGLSEDLEKDAEGVVQKLTDRFTAEVDNMTEVKEKEILTV